MENTYSDVQLVHKWKCTFCKTLSTDITQIGDIKICCKCLAKVVKWAFSKMKEKQYA